ncbi:hypothetical protein ACFL17_08130 [Pseudomonadota bacterium]
MVDLPAGGVAFQLVSVTTTTVPLIVMDAAGDKIPNLMKSISISSLFVLLIAWLGAVQAQTVIYNSQAGDPVFSITYPQGWSVDFNFKKPLENKDAPPPPRVVQSMPDDGSRIWLGVWLPPYLKDIQDGPKYLESLEQYILTEVKANDPVSQSLNGMPALIIRGSAKKDRDAVEWTIAFFQASRDIVGAALYVGVVEDKKKHQSELDALIDSIRPAR